MIFFFETTEFESLSYIPEERRNSRALRWPSGPRQQRVEFHVYLSGQGRSHRGAQSGGGGLPDGPVSGEPGGSGAHTDGVRENTRS